MGGKEHFERLQSLLDLEREAEKQENLRELRKFPVAQREAITMRETEAMDGSASPRKPSVEM